MMKKLSLSEQHIVDGLKTHYGIYAVALTLLPIGADLNASVYKVEARDQASYFVKVRVGDHSDINTIMLSLLKSAEIQRVILPIQTSSGQLTQRIESFSLTVFPFVDGQDGFSRDLSDEQWVMLGKAIRRLHDAQVPASIQSVIRKETYSPKWRDAVRSLYAHIESKQSGDKVALQLTDFMKQHKLSIQRLVDRAEQLSLKVQAQQPQFVLCHSDIHGGNVLIDKNDIIYIVDWDEPIMAPKECDLMFIGGGVANVWNKPHEEVLFYKGYGETDINMTILAYYRHERIVEDIAVLGEQLLLTSSGGASRMESYQHFIDQFEPRGVVEIAFETDEEAGK